MNRITARNYCPKEIKETNQFLISYLNAEFDLEEENIIHIMIDYKFQLEQYETYHLRPVGCAMYQRRFIQDFEEALKLKKPCIIYKGSWDGQMSYWASGHDIRLSFAIYHNDKVHIRRTLGEEKFEKLKDIIDKNGMKLRWSNYDDRNYRD